MSLGAKRFAKSVAVGAALAAGGTPPPESITRTLLRMMKIGYEPPGVKVVYPGGAPSAACISIDFDATIPERLGPNGTGTSAVLALSERYRIPLTWAMCGRTVEEDWPSYRRIVDSPVRQEVGVHTYSHVDATKVTPEQLKEEVEHCISVLKLPERPKTFVFPWNRVAHFKTIEECGFVAYRDKSRVIGLPKKVQGLWNIPPVWYLDRNSLGAARLIGKVMDLCIASGSVFHLWFHPWSVVEPTPEEFTTEVLEPVFAGMADARDKGRLSILTMGEIGGAMEDGLGRRSG